MRTAYSRSVMRSSVWGTAALSQQVPSGPIHSHQGARIWVAEWLQKPGSGGSRRACEGRFPCKWVVAHTGFEPVLPP